MPTAFLNHKTEEKKNILKIKRYLESALIDTWLDQEDLPAGSHLSSALKSGIKENDFFIAFISEMYLDSQWCLDELQTAINSDIQIIPVLNGELEDIKKKAPAIVEKLISEYAYVEFDAYNIPKTAELIKKAINERSKVWFDPVEKITVDGLEMLLIKMNIVWDIPTDFLKHWNFNIENFLKKEPLAENLPIALFGKAPAWLYTFLAIPLCNLRDVYVYNKSSGGFICTYAQRLNLENLGSFIPYEKTN